MLLLTKDNVERIMLVLTKGWYLRIIMLLLTKDNVAT